MRISSQTWTQIQIHIQIQIWIKILIQIRIQVQIQILAARKARASLSAAAMMTSVSRQVAGTLEGRFRGCIPNDKQYLFESWPFRVLRVSPRSSIQHPARHVPFSASL